MQNLVQIYRFGSILIKLAFYYFFFEWINLSLQVTALADIKFFEKKKKLLDSKFVISFKWIEFVKFLNSCLRERVVN